MRPVRVDGECAIREFLEDVSPESIAFRFGSPSTDWVVAWTIDVDYSERFALVAETGNPCRVVAHAVYVRSAPERAEVACRSRARVYVVRSAGCDGG